VYSDLKLGHDKRAELEELYRSIEILDERQDEVPMIDHLWAVQQQSYELLSLHYTTEQEQKLFQESQENIAHEFQIRLQALMADAENLSRALRIGQRVSERMHQDASEVLHGVKRLSVLVHNLRFGLGDYQWKATAISDLVNAAAILYETEAKRKGVSISLDVEKVNVELSKRHIEHVMNNLVHNAVKYSFRSYGQKERIIRIRGKREENEYVLEFENYGVGILPHETAKIFDKGYRGELTEDEDRTGAGLGLPIAKDIVNAHNGSISVKSSRVGGPYLTCFTVTLPVSREKAR
jgi:signal transduction histidine kinase